MTDIEQREELKAAASSAQPYMLRELTLPSRRRGAGAPGWLAPVAAVIAVIAVIVSVQVIFRAIPATPNDNRSGVGSRSGGRIAIGPDGFLYMTVGDRDAGGSFPWRVAQTLDTHLGKILRLTLDGKPAPVGRDHLLQCGIRQCRRRGHPLAQTAKPRSRR